MMTFITHAACFAVGAFFGVCAMCLMFAAGRADEQLEQMENERRENE